MADNLKGTLYNELLQKVESCKEDYIKAKNGTRTSCSKVRATMLAIKKMTEAIYKEMNCVKK